MKAVFDTSVESAYDDEISERYHFPRQYLKLVNQTVADWVVFRQPRASGGSKSYFAAAKVMRVEPDVEKSGHFYAYLGEFFEFARPVPWQPNGDYAELALRNIKPVSQVGLYLRGKSVRVLEDADFARIVEYGLAETLAPENRRRLDLGVQDFDQATFEYPMEEQVRRVEQMLVNRKIRDANFRQQVCEAYEDRCAVTGLKIINGGGRSEVQAAHIWSVADGGPDIVQNGLALSGTVHWLFDRHLISLTDEYRLLVSHNKVPAELRSLFEKQMDRIHLPRDRRLWPHQNYLRRHREAFMAA
jgi:putative restriction endonuclease